MPQIPTSLTGMIGFLLIGSFLLLEFQGSALLSDPKTPINQLYEDSQRQIVNIQRTTTEKPTDWFSAILNVGSVIISFIALILAPFYVPIILLASFITAIASLPLEISLPLSALLSIGFVLAFAKFIWAKRDSGGTA